ncbi:hypothetical protein B0H17DRAFT_1215407 [Mycena rosella]|uniref:Uncharacterized protein n=1 Tax=Mycena rosella TaxID=1033263 RepID=A0AAD7CHC8_MYCRO|nr:hypothetical protein B0H17DRAFT_1215407 [Mycena rosella]
MLIFLPSALSAELRASGCNKGVATIETRLQDAQCRSALDAIQNYLHVKSRFRTYKGMQVRHQGATTRLHGLTNRNDDKIRMHGEKYVAAWEAKRALVGDEEVGWHRMDVKKDLRCMDSEEDRAHGSLRKIRKKGKKRMLGEAATAEDITNGVTEGRRRKDPTGEGRRVVSWIWTGTDLSAAGTNEAVANEEVNLLKEEMRCTPITLRWKAAWWMEQCRPEGFEDSHVKGAAAYATRQADLHERIADKFETLWVGLQDFETVEGLEYDPKEVEAPEDDDEQDTREEEEEGNDEEGDENDGEEEEEGSVGILSDGEEGE